MEFKQKIKITDRVITKVSSAVAGITLLCVVIWGISSIWKNIKYQHTNDAQVQEYINPVIARVGGYITRVSFEENQMVKQGDTLLVIDNREYLYEEAQTQATIKKQLAEIRVIEKTKHTTHLDAEAAKSRLKANEAKVWKQDLEYKRYAKLYEAESATSQQLENVLSNKDIAESELNTAKQAYEAANSKLADLDAQKTVLYAEIDRLESLEKRKKLDVDYTVITAPYDGRMGKRTIEMGQMINPGQVLAFIVNDETPKWIIANFKETQIHAMRVNDEVKLIADAYPDIDYVGKIISISPATGSSFSLLPPDNATGNYVKIVQRVPVRIELVGNREVTDLLKAGMNVNVYVPKNQNHATK